MSPAAEPLLAIYTERLPQVRRVFRLYPDRVEVAAKWTFGRKFAITVRLGELSGQFSRFNVKNRWFPKAVVIGSLAVGVALVLARPGYPELVRRGSVIGWPIAGIAFVVALLSLPRRQFVHFPRANGKPGLDICKAGPDQGRFESFVAEVRKCITRA
jgi:hypothetical protein